MRWFMKSKVDFVLSKEISEKAAEIAYNRYASRKSLRPATDVIKYMKKGRILSTKYHYIVNEKITDKKLFKEILKGNILS